MKLPNDVLAYLRNNAVAQRDSDWGPNPFVCEFCDCWLYSMDAYGRVVKRFTEGLIKTSALP